jgi:hypothetical protein
MRTKPQAFLALIGLCLLSACGSDSTGISGDASGSYDLALVNNAPPPYIYFQDATTTDRITGGNFTLNEDGTFTQTLEFDETIVGEGTTTDASTCNGTYTQSGGNFTFTEVDTADGACGGIYSGSWNGDERFTFSLGVASLVYTK